jgi:hypothetical protein
MEVLRGQVNSAILIQKGRMKSRNVLKDTNLIEPKGEIP